MHNIFTVFQNAVLQCLVQHDAKYDYLFIYHICDFTCAEVCGFVCVFSVYSYQSFHGSLDDKYGPA